ncbi:hypothetical protein B0H11DRAFT_2003050 [Mycena galericulata]|nr:hypothetical protein B0H11DRAFT_2003050 [Mycena galericulata]
MDLALAETVGEGLFSRILIPLLKSPPFEPEKIVPVYFPAWFIDAEVEFNASVTSHQGAVDNGRMTAVFLNSYIPGHTMDTLSTISLLSEDLAFHETVPFSADLETQYDTKIQCLPFKTAPLSIIDEAKSLQPDQLVVSRKLRIDPSSISTNLLCAYPVLIPLYLAQYAVNWGEDTDPVYKTALIEAHSVKGRIIVENVPYQLPSQEEEGPLHADNFIIRALERQRVKLVRLSQKLDQETTVLKRQLEERGMGPAETNFLYLRGKATPFHNLSTITTPPTWDISNIQGYMNWLESFMTADGLKQLVTTGDVGMDDPRIRPFTVKELKGARKFLALGQERSKAYDLLEVGRPILKVLVANGHDSAHIED